MNNLREQLVTIFERSKLKTIGDLIDSELSGLEGAEKFPARIREHSLDPRNMHVLPEMFLYDARRGGVPGETVEAVGNRAFQFREDMVRQVLGRPAMEP
jgi:hypothetical protein